MDPREDEGLLQQQLDYFKQDDDEIPLAVIKEEVKQEYPSLPQNHDFWVMIQEGKFDILPLIDDLEVRINRLDGSGYSILHHAITYNHVHVVRYLVERGADIHLKSNRHQTCLMIACNFGFNEIVGELLTMGSDRKAIDSFRFDALLYAWKGSHYNIVLYLICFTSLSQSDLNGCSLQHWAAYNNDIFLLGLLEVFGLFHKNRDNMNMTPFHRAVQNVAYDAVTFYADRHPDQIIKENQEFTKSIDKIIQTRRQRTTIRFYPILLSIGCLLLASIMVYGYTHVLAEQDSNAYVVNFMMQVSMMYCVCYSLWFLNRTPSGNKQEKLHPLKKHLGDPKLHDHAHGHEAATHCDNPALNIDVEPLSTQNWYTYQLSPPYLSGITEEEFKTVDFEPVDSLLSSKYVSSFDPHDDMIDPFGGTHEKANLWYKKYSIIHQVYYLWETRQYDRLSRIDYRRVCSLCLQYQPPRTWHHKDRCVEDYSHYSYPLQKLISSNNHLTYLMFLFGWLMVCTSYTFTNFYVFTSRCKQQTNPFIDYSWTLIPIEILYLTSTTETSPIIPVLYALVGTWSLYLWMIVILEVYCLMMNITYHELMHSEKYPYLFEPRQKKNGKTVSYWIDRFNLICNFQNYLGNAFNKLHTL